MKTLYIARGIRKGQDANSDAVNVGMNNIIATGSYASPQLAKRYMLQRATDIAHARGYDSVALYDASKCFDEIDLATQSKRDMRITTNNVPRDLIGWHDLTQRERDDFDYIKPEEECVDDMHSRFFRYKGWVFDTYDFTSTRTLHASDMFKDWDGYHGDSYFSGTLLRYVDEGERIIVGTYYC